MTVKQLIDKLNEFPQDMPVATWGDIDWKSKDDPNFVEVCRKTWTHNNYPYNKEPFDYIDVT